MKGDRTQSISLATIVTLMLVTGILSADQKLGVLYTLSVDWNWCLSFGRSVAWIGDRDGDSVSDLAVGLKYDFPNEVYLFSGADGGLLDSLYSPGTGHRFGWSLCGVENPDTEGLRSLLISAIKEEPDTCPSWWNSGRVYLFYPGTDELVYSLESPNAEENGQFGWCVSDVPGLDGGGTAGLAIGTPWEDPGGSPDEAGRAYLFSGSTGELVHELVSPNEEFQGFFGCSMTGLGDVDGDAIGDVAVGAYGEDGPGGLIDAGRVYLFSGATGDLLRVLYSPQAECSGYFGWSVACAGDPSGDGVNDLLVGAPWEDPGESPGFAGRVYVFSGYDGEVIHSFCSPNEQWDGHFGETVSSTRDADGDGVADVLVGAPNEHPGSSPRDAGRAYLFSGFTGALLHVLASPDEDVDGHFGAALSGFQSRRDGDMLLAVVGAPGEWGERGRAYVFGEVAQIHVSPSRRESGIVLSVISHPSEGNHIRFLVRLFRTESVAMSVFDIAGRQLDDFFQGVLQGGSHTIVWGGHDRTGELVRSGAYLCRIEGKEVNDSAVFTIIR